MTFHESLLLFVTFPAFVFAAGICIGQALRKPKRLTRGFGD